MLKLSEKDIIARIQQESCFEATLDDGSLTLKIDSYMPVLCTAIHAGHRLRPSLEKQCRLSAKERLQEEDPFTDDMIQALPITLIACDSRYEYDLNRPIANCLYRTAWGKEVWHKMLSTKERSISIAKHQRFYRILDTLIQTLEARFGAALIFDVHSFNQHRQPADAPTFNFGSEQINKDRWLAALQKAKTFFQAIELPNIPTSAAENQVFHGRGYLISHVNSRFQNTLVLPLEVKKVFMDEDSGEPYPVVLQHLCEQMKNGFLETTRFFSRRFIGKRDSNKSSFLANKIDPTVLQVDRELFQLAHKLETLQYINPVNLSSERKKFFRLRGDYQPNFHYRQLEINPYEFREQLYRLPVMRIRDPNVQSLYRDVVDSLSGKVDLLVKAGSPQFLYESLKYYGEPSSEDVSNAKFLLHAPNIDTPLEKNVNAELLRQQFLQASHQYAIPCKIEISSKLVASAMVSNARKTVYINRNVQLNQREARALIEHELGVHMATTLNAKQQRLKVFSLGLPGNTFTQEGLAILNEFQSGNLSISRLQGLSLRVLAVKEMLKRNSFYGTYRYLRDEHGLPSDAAFQLTVRVHRGGGFTKDYLYLRGFSAAIQLHQQRDIRNLFIGKTGFDYIDVINEMVERKWVQNPTHVPSYLEQPEQSDTVLSYLVGSIGYHPPESHSVNRQPNAA